MHGERSLVGALGLGIVLALRVEASDSQEVEHLLVHLLLAAYQAVNHLFGIGIERWEVEIEIHLRC